MTVYFGFAEAEITPRGSVTLGGYAARSARSEGVADPLRAHVLSFRGDDRRFVLVVLDLLALTRRESDILSEHLATLTDLNPGDFEFACTHTHAAPNVTASPLIGDAPVEREYLDALPEQLVGAVRSAVESESPLEAGWARGEVEGVGASRISPNGAFSVPATVLSLNEVCAVEFGCHPTVLGHDNLLVSGDLFGAARRSLSQSLDAPGVFLQGASADISARHTRREQSLDEVQRLGDLLADEAYGIWRRTEEPHPVSGLSVGRTSVELPLKERVVSEERLREAEIALDRARETASHAELREAQTELEGLRIEHRLAGMEDVESRCPVFVAKIGGIGLVGIGGELPSGLGREISERSPLRPTVVLGCASGYVGYLMGRDAEPGSYEALASPYEAGAGNVIVEAALDLLYEVA